MNKILFDFILIILLFLFIWKVLGKALIRTVAPEPNVREPDVDPTNASELRVLRATLAEKLTKLKNKNQIAQVQKQLDEVDANLAKLP